MDDSRFAPTLAARLFPFAFATTAGAPVRTRPGRHIPFEPHPRLTPSAPPPVVPPEHPSIASRLARLGVWLLLVLGWAVFVAWWAIVLRRESLAALTRAGLVLAAIIVVCGVVMTAWTRYNMWVARRGMRGRSSRYIPMQWERDTLGRPLHLPEGGLAHAASELQIVLRDGAKSYVVVSEETL